MACIPTPAFADMNWHSESLTYQYGKEFKVDAQIVQTITYEHVSDWTWGDIYFFMDNNWYPGGVTYNDGHHSIYTEAAPRLSLGKMFNRTLSYGPVKDILIATTIEWDKNDRNGEHDQVNYLLGPGFDLALPGFDYFQINFYYRKPDGGIAPAGQWQITPSWSYTIPVGRSDLVIDGYMDWVVNNKGDSHRNLLFNPQVKYDIGKHLGYGEKHFYAGVEYDYWSNKYAIESTSEYNTDESVTSLIMKYYF
ncbi:MULTISPECIES: outer membrane protein OmpK [Pseudomonas]|nr:MULTISPECIES: outer membrane protein OmpK [Pseudomonas]